MSNANHPRYSEVQFLSSIVSIQRDDFIEPLHPMVANILFKGEPAVEDKSGVCDARQSGTAGSTVCRQCNGEGIYVHSEEYSIMCSCKK